MMGDYVDPHQSMYDLVYTGELKENMQLDDIFRIFNLNHPINYISHSLSVSDIIVLNRKSSTTVYFVDDFGFVEIKGFFDPY